MKTDAQIDADFALIRAALKRALPNSMPRNKAIVFCQLIEDILGRLNVSRDDAVVLLTGMAYAYAVYTEQPAKPVGEASQPEPPN